MMRAPPSHKSSTAGQIVNPVVVPQVTEFGADAKRPRRLKGVKEPRVVSAQQRDQAKHVTW
jgi:hypothetical protein